MPTRMLRAALALVGLAVASAINDLGAASALATLSARAFVWAKHPSLEGFAAGPQADGKILYQATPTSALAAMLGDKATPEVTVVVVGQHMLAKPQSAATVAGLDAVRKAAPAWAALQQVVVDKAAPQPLSAQLAATGRNVHVAGDCALEEASATVKHVEGGAEAAAAFVRAAAADSPLLLLVCLPAGGNEASEVAAVAALDDALQQSGKDFLGVYASEPQGAVVGAARRSLLLFGFGGADEDKNDELFFLQASLVRALVVVLFTLVALLSGLCCLMSLDTPTRFETQMRTDSRN